MHTSFGVAPKVCRNSKGKAGLSAAIETAKFREAACNFFLIFKPFIDFERCVNLIAHREKVASRSEVEGIPREIGEREPPHPALVCKSYGIFPGQP
jgi:hypothetical protein